ncbi:MAG: GNAT family N-acetyltransferase, partial [Mucinivorans sp.]
MEEIIAPVDREALKAELTDNILLRPTNKARNFVYVFKAAQAPFLMREVGRLREEAFRAAGGGTGAATDIDAYDIDPDGYYQLIVWDPASEEIVGGYRYIIPRTEYPKCLSTEHYFEFSDQFRREYLPYTIELGRSFVQTKYQA